IRKKWHSWFEMSSIRKNDDQPFSPGKSSHGRLLATIVVDFALEYALSSDIHSLVGQSLMFRFIGPEFTSADREAFNRIRPGVVLFFGNNLTIPQQIIALTAQLQAAAQEEGLPPLFSAADQEGGIVTRLPADMVTVPSA